MTIHFASQFTFDNNNRHCIIWYNINITFKLNLSTHSHSTVWIYCIHSSHVIFNSFDLFVFNWVFQNIHEYVDGVWVVLGVCVCVGRIADWLHADLLQTIDFSKFPNSKPSFYYENCVSLNQVAICVMFLAAAQYNCCFWLWFLEDTSFSVRIQGVRPTAIVNNICNWDIRRRFFFVAALSVHWTLFSLYEYTEEQNSEMVAHCCHHWYLIID